MTTAVRDINHKKQFHWGQLILGICLFIFTLFCFLPILLVVISAFTAESEINATGFTYFPKQWSMDGMNAVLRYGAQLRQSYFITISVTVLGTFFGLLIMSMFAYSISRRDFKMKGFLSVFLLIPMLFSGGQLSAYIFFSKYYGLKDTLWVLILPLCVSTMNVIILRTYIHSSIPDELMEAAKIDGADTSADETQSRGCWIHDGNSLLERLAERVPVHRQGGSETSAAAADQHSEIDRNAVEQQEHSVVRPAGYGQLDSPVFRNDGNRNRSCGSGYYRLPVLPEVLYQGFDGRFGQGLITCLISGGFAQ